MDDTHVPFARRFASPAGDDLLDPDFMAIWGLQGDGTRRWEELHEHRCVVILGEGKSGKTHEFKQQCKALRQQGKFSFFIPLELLQNSDFVDVITEDEEQELKRWSTETDDEAVFFLDAVDELILREGNLRSAIRKIKNAIGIQAHRARFFISCRPGDWQQELDLPTVASLVVPRARATETIRPPGDDDFFSFVITHERRSAELDDSQEYQSETVKVLALLPLTRTETLEFAKLYRPAQVADFELHLDKKELWHLYQLPSEIMTALEQLVTDGHLGNLEEQLEFGIGQKLRDRPGRPQNTLSEQRAKDGAERIALALFLMKRRSIYREAPHRDMDGVCVADLLTDWSSEEQIELLGKPLFDPSGVGAVRFHHRATQEYLAAKRLNNLRKAGLAIGDLYSLLFAKVGDEKVIIPSMEPVIAWMAIWHSDIQAEVKERNPLLLFRQGLPALLPVGLRATLIRRFVERFAGSKWRGISVGHQELQRVASPELAPVVREVWEQAYKGYDTRELLLELIYLTSMPECADLAYAAAQDSELPVYHRAYAVLGIINSGTGEQKHQIGASIAKGEWPERVVRVVLPELLPEALNVTQFLSLARSLKEVPRTVHGLEYALLQAVKSSAVSDAQRIIIRDDFTEAIVRNPTPASRIYQTHSQYDHFVECVIAACHMTVPKSSESIHDWAWSLAVGFHFGTRRTSIIARKETEELKSLLTSSILHREGFFWACFDLSETLQAPENDWDRFMQTDYDRLLCPFTTADFPWLLHALSPDQTERKRGVAFFALSAFIKSGNNPDLAAQISDLVSDRADLREEFTRAINPPINTPSRRDAQHRKWEEERKAEQQEIIDDWEQWRKDVLADSDFLLGEADREHTLSNLLEFLELVEGSNGTWGHWDSHYVERAFSLEFLNTVRKVLCLYWRQTNVQLYSERPEDSRRYYLQNHSLALAAVKCNAEDPDWAAALTYEEAILAVRISMLEQTGFARFLPQIEATHPRAIEEVISGEVQAQVEILLNGGTAPFIEEVLYHGTTAIQKCAADSLAANRSNIEKAMSNDARNDLKCAFELIGLQGSDDALQDAVNAIKRHLNGETQLTAAGREFWIHILAKLNLESACEIILACTADLSTPELREDAISLFAAIFGRHFMEGKPIFDSLAPGRRLELLQDLVIRAYHTIQPKDDPVHEGGHSPQVRDYATNARSYLLGCLATTTSPRTLSVLYELSERREFIHISDRLKQMATELAAQISEPAAMNATTFREFDQERNYLPYDKPSLLAVMNNRLADFEHHIINDENSTIDTLRKVETETGLRRFISDRLSLNSRGAYTTTQEGVVVAEKRTDIRLYPKGLDQYASIEVKLDDASNKWSGADLKKALVDQLVGRYLNHERCQVGCLLICMREARRWHNPDTNNRMDLTETVTWLQGIADKIKEERPELFISVIGIDYSATANE